MNEVVISKEEIRQLITSFGIEKGDTICLQANLENSRYQSLIEGIMKVVGEEGCLFVPSFSFSTLDPASRDSRKYDYEDYELVRNELNGYQAKISMSDVYKGCNNQFSRYKVSRSVHPVYSFTYWGSFTQDSLKQTMNYPISFQSSLKDFTKKRAFNIIIGEQIENSVLIPAIAQTMNMGVTVMQRAYTMRNQKNVFHTYLHLKVDKEEINKILDMCIIQQNKLGNQEVTCISIQK